jgi:tetratricopeptide (TPR) repeat protein
MKVKNCSLFFCWLIILNSYIANLSANEETLDALFLALKYAPDEATANVYVSEIWYEWFQSGDETIDGLMQEAMRKRRNYDFAGAIEILNKVIEIDQSYPEAWNLEDIAETLVLEPRHFGAMAGRAVIRLYQSKSALARQNIIEASKIHPYLKERAFFPDLVQ